MNVLVIPDVHLRWQMFTRANAIMNQNIADRAVCLMDIPDDWGKAYCIDEYERTFNEAVNFAREFPETRWCWGNHDLSYRWRLGQSGYSPAAEYTVQKKLIDLIEAIPEGNPIGYVQRIDNVLFSHGGLLDYFVDEYAADLDKENIDAVIKRINSLGPNEMWNDASPIWLRPQNAPGRLYKADECLQVVGHTPVSEITRDRNLISTDVFSTDRSGKPAGSREFLLLDTLSWEYKGIKM